MRVPALWMAATVFGLGMLTGLVLSAGRSVADQLAYSQLTASVASSTVAGLPTCNAAAQGQLYLATDALTPVALSAATGGGAVKTLVACTGASWVVG